MLNGEQVVRILERKSIHKWVIIVQLLYLNINYVCFLQSANADGFFFARETCGMLL